MLPILNSNLINYLFSTKFLNLGIKKDYLNKISFPIVTPEDQHLFIDLTKKMLELNSKLIVCKTPQEEKLLKMQIDNLVKQMNRMVYKLYELTEDEIDYCLNNIDNYIKYKRVG